TNVSTSAELMTGLAREWKADVDVEHPVAPTTTRSPISLIVPPADSPKPAEAAAATPDEKYATLTKSMNTLDGYSIRSGEWTITPDGHIRGQGDSALDLDMPLPDNSLVTFK